MPRSLEFDPRISIRPSVLVSVPIPKNINIEINKEPKAKTKIAFSNTRLSFLGWLINAIKINILRKIATSKNLEEYEFILIMLINIRIKKKINIGQKNLRLFLSILKKILKLGKIQIKYKIPINFESEKVPSRPTESKLVDKKYKYKEIFWNNNLFNFIV